MKAAPVDWNLCECFELLVVSPEAFSSLEASTPRFLESGRPRPGFRAVLVHEKS